MSISRNAKISTANRGGRRLAANKGQVGSAFSSAFSGVKGRWASFMSKPMVQKVAGKTKVLGAAALVKLKDAGTDLRAGYRAFRASYAERQDWRRLESAIELLQDKGYEVKPVEVTPDQMDQAVKRTEMDRITEDPGIPVEPFVPDGAAVPVSEEEPESIDVPGADGVEDADGPESVVPHMVNPLNPPGLDDDDLGDTDLGADDPVFAAPVDLTDAGYSMMGIRQSLNESSRKGIMECVVAMRDYLSEFLATAPGERDFEAVAREMGAGGGHVMKLAREGREVPDVPDAVPEDAGQYYGA